MSDRANQTLDPATRRELLRRGLTFVPCLYCDGSDAACRDCNGTGGSWEPAADAETSEA